MMTISALNTQRVLIGQMVTVPFIRHPSVTANATASVDEISNGRVFLGIGAGGSAVKSMGLETRPLRELEKVVRFFRDYTNGMEVAIGEQKIKSEWISRSIPIYMAASGPKSLELAGELADGVITMGGPPFVIKWKLAHIIKGAERVGRDPSKISIWVRSYIYVTENKGNGHRELANTLSTSAGLPKFDPNDSEIQGLYKKMDSEFPGILDDIARVKSAMKSHAGQNRLDPWFAKIDAPWASLVTQRMIDSVHLIGRPQDIVNGVNKYAECGVTGIATSVSTIIQKREMIEKVGREVILPYYNN